MSTEDPKAYEHRDVNVLGVALFGAALVLLVAVVMLLMGWLFGAHGAPPLASVEPPPEPRLLGSPGHPTLGPEDLQQLLASEEAVLNSYTWVDRGAGIVRIPIARAMKLLVQRGLPVRPHPSGDAGEWSPSAASSGAVLERWSP